MAVNDNKRGTIQTATEALESADDAQKAKNVQEFARLLRKDVQFGDAGIKLQNLDQGVTLAKAIAESTLNKPDKHGNKASYYDILLRLQSGMELGMPVMMAFKHVHIIDGVISLSVEFCAAIVERHKGLEPGTKIKVRIEGEPRTDNWSFIATSMPRGSNQWIESPPVYWSDFKHLHNRRPWQNYPARMMKARAVGYHIKDFYAAQIGGVSIAEDVQDYSATSSKKGSPLDNAPAYDAATDPLVGWMSGKTPEPKTKQEPPAPDNDFVAAYESAEGK